MKLCQVRKYSKFGGIIFLCCGVITIWAFVLSCIVAKIIKAKAFKWFCDWFEVVINL